MRAVEVPIYDFTRHQRSRETRRVEPADVVILEVRAAVSRRAATALRMRRLAVLMESALCSPGTVS